MLVAAVSERLSRPPGTLAEEPRLYSPRWTDDILDEARRDDLAIKRQTIPVEVLRRLAKPLPRLSEFVAEKQGWTV